MGFRMLKDAGDGRQRMIGRVALTQGLTSGYRATPTQNRSCFGPDISSSAANKAEFCRFTRKPAVICQECARRPPHPRRRSGRYRVMAQLGPLAISKQLASKTQFSGLGRLRTYLNFMHSAFL
jgi:hypothetical protein